ncbi:unnamed protein product [Paramecium pentaurelia]|uniref:Tetratricopeptide repeat protein n=1 Tax=Paramecium pentaurelia TaxID=43138 RepID=A0A8S1S735_9CILI|nr:unnamed protein product [Paramecium pentaurelia]
MNPQIFTCNYLTHNLNPIIKFCLNENCKSTKDKLCEICWKEFHEEHLLDCFPITILYYILEIHLKKIEQLLQRIQSLSIENQCNSFYQELIVYQDKFKKLIQNQLDEIHLYQDIQILIRLAKQCYNNEIQKLLIAFVWTQQIEINTKNTIIQIIEEVYSLEDPQYFSFILNQQIEDLLYLCKYNHALQKINYALKLKKDYVLQAKKYSILIILGKDQEANQLIAHQDDYNYDNFLQGHVISLVNYHYYKRQHQNDDRFNLQLFQSVSLLEQGKIKEANKIIKEELAKKPESLDIIMFYVKCLIFYQNKIQKAIKFCQQGLLRCKLFVCQCKIQNNFILIIYRIQMMKQKQHIVLYQKIIIAIILIKQGEFQKAIEFLNSIQKNSKKYSEAQSFRFIAIKLFSKNKTVFSIQSYEQHRQINSPLIVFISEVKQLFLEKQFKNALDIVEKKLLKLPQCLFLTLLKSTCLITLQKYGLAQQYLEPLRIQYPNEFIIEICYVYTLVGMKQYIQALEIMNNLPLKEQKYEFLELRAQILFHQGLLSESMDCFKLLQSNEYNKSKINIYMGLINQIQKQYTIAIYYYDQELKNETYKQQLLYNKALAILEKNITQNVQPNDLSFEEAKKIFQSLIDIYDSQWFLVIVYYLQNNFNEAHNLLEILKKDSQKIEKALKLQAKIYYKQQLFGIIVSIYQKINFSFLNKNEISQYIISAILIKNFELADSLINKCQQQLQSLFYLFKGFKMEQEGKNLESSKYYEEFCQYEQPQQTASEYPLLIQAAKLALRQIYMRLDQNQKVIEFENSIKQHYPNLPLDTNYEQFIIKEFQIITYPVKPIAFQLEIINLNLLMDFRQWCILIDKYDFMNIYQFEQMFKQ